MNQQIGGKSKQMLPPQPAMSSSLSSEQVLATPLSLLLDDPSIGDSQNPITHPEKEVTNIRNNVQISSVNKQRKRPIHSVNLTATSSATTSAAPYSIALDATPSDGHTNTYSEMPSSIRGVNPSLRKQVHHSIPNSSSTIQATNSSIVFTNNPSY